MHFGSYSLISDDVEFGTVQEECTISKQSKMIGELCQLLCVFTGLSPLFPCDCLIFICLLTFIAYITRKRIALVFRNQLPLYYNDIPGNIVYACLVFSLAFGLLLNSLHLTLTTVLYTYSNDNDANIMLQRPGTKLLFYFIIIYVIYMGFGAVYLLVASPYYQVTYNTNRNYVTISYNLHTAIRKNLSILKFWTIKVLKIDSNHISISIKCFNLFNAY